MTSRGYISGAGNVNYNPNLLVEWSYIYLQILDKYESKCVVIRVFVIFDLNRGRFLVKQLCNQDRLTSYSRRIAIVIAIAFNWWFCWYFNYIQMCCQHSGVAIRVFVIFDLNRGRFLVKQLCNQDRLTLYSRRIVIIIAITFNWWFCWYFNCIQMCCQHSGVAIRVFVIFDMNWGRILVNFVFEMHCDGYWNRV